MLVKPIPDRVECPQDDDAVRARVHSGNAHASRSTPDRKPSGTCLPSARPSAMRAPDGARSNSALSAAREVSDGPEVFMTSIIPATHQCFSRGAAKECRHG